MHISIHAPTRGATIPDEQRSYYENISIHAPTRGATPFPSPGGLYDTFQSTLPREERHSSVTRTTGSTAISIHAPTRGATAHFCSSCLYENISIHAPTRGATLRQATRTSQHFKISIHAPTRGATTCGVQCKSL